MPSLSITATMQVTNNPAINSNGVPSFVNIVHPAFPIWTSNKNTVQWTVDENSVTWARSTKIIAIVLGKKIPSSTGINFLFSKKNSRDFFASELSWAPPRGASPGSTVLFLSSSSTGTWTLKVTNRNVRKFAGIQQILYRIYFYTPDIGIWFRDPELDLCPIGAGG